MRTLLLAAATAGTAAFAAPAPTAPTGGAPVDSKPAAKATAAKAAAPGVKPTAAKPAVKVSPMAFTPKALDLAPGETYPVELFVPSPTGKAVSGKLTFTPAKGLEVKPDARWSDKVPGWGTKTYPTIAAAADAQGALPVTAELEKGGKATLTVNVAPPHLELVPGSFKLTVKVTNPFKSRPMTGRIIASNKDRFLEDVTTREFKIPPGQTAEVVFPLPGASPVIGEKYDFVLDVQTYQGYRDKKTYPLEFPQNTDK